MALGLPQADAKPKFRSCFSTSSFSTAYTVGTGIFPAPRAPLAKF
jgi:hypothetical protein